MFIYYVRLKHLMQKRGLFLSLFIFVLVFSLFSSMVFAKQVDITSYCDVALESCKTQDQALELLVEKYPYDIHVDYLYYFDISDVQSSLAQIALECANKQSMKDVYKAELQNNLDLITRESLKQYADNVNLASANFSFCLDTQATAWDVLDQVEEAEDDGVTSVPSVRFNMDIYTGSQTFTSLHTLAKEYLDLAEDEEVSEEIGEEAVAQVEPIEPVDMEETYVGAPEIVGTPEEGQEVLDQIEEPLFFRVISQFSNWLLSVFGS